MPAWGILSLKEIKISYTEPIKSYSHSEAFVQDIYIITYTFINPLISILAGKQYMLDDYIVFWIIAQLYLSIQTGSK
jgi:hypothetical protein